MTFSALSWLKRSGIENVVTAVALINLVLAATALLKDIIMASYLGTSTQADAFLLAFFIPDTVGNNLIATALGVACIPLFSRLCATGDRYRLTRAFTGTSIYFSVLAVILLLIFYLFRIQVIHALGAGMEEGSRELCVELFNIILPSVAIFPAASIGMAVLQVHGRFTIPALGPVLLNLVIFGSVLYAYLRSLPLQAGVFLLAASILAGVAAMAGLTWAAVKIFRIRVFESPRIADLISPPEETKEILRVFIPYLGILLTFQAVLAVERYLASSLEVGSIAGLNYAYRIAQFPLWVFVAAVSSVAFPTMSKAVGLDRVAELKETLGKSLSAAIVATVPLTVLLFVLREPVVAILLQRGSFDGGSVQVTSGILAGYSLSIVFQGVVVICLRAFLATGRYAVPLLVTFFSAGLNIVFDFILVDIAGSAGLGYGAAAGAFVNSAILLWMLDRELGLGIKRHQGVLARILAANLPVLLAAGMFYKIWFLMDVSGLWARLAFAFGAAAVALIAYLAGLHLLKINKYIPDSR